MVRPKKRARSSIGGPCLAPRGHPVHLSALERQRELNIRENEAFLKALGVDTVKSGLHSEDLGEAQPGNGGNEPLTSPRDPSAGFPPLTINEVRSRWWGREEQVRQLERYYKYADEDMPRSVMVHGPSGGGKTGVVTELLGGLRLPHLCVSALEHHTARSLYGAIARAWLRLVERTLARRSTYDKKGERVVLLDYDDNEEDDQEEEDGGPLQSEAGLPALHASVQGDHNYLAGQTEYDGAEGRVRRTDEGVGALSWRRQSSCGSMLRLVRLLQHYASVMLESRAHICPTHSHSMVDPPTGCDRDGPSRLPLVIVLDNADRLPRSAANVIRDLQLLPAQIPQDSCLAVSVVKICESPLDMLPGASAAERVAYMSVEFPAYTRAQINELLLRVIRAEAGRAVEGPKGGQGGDMFESVVGSFVRLVVASLYGATKNLREILRVTNSLADMYLMPIMAKCSDSQAAKQEPSSGVECTVDEGAMMEKIAPLIRVMVSEQLHLAEPMPTDSHPAPAAPPAQALINELPRLSRFLLLAAYLAAHNQAQTDMFVFTSRSQMTKRTGGRRRTAPEEIAEAEQRAIAEEEATAEESRAFALERLLSIFQSLVTFSRPAGAGYAARTGTTELFTQIAWLVESGLLTRIKGRNMLTSWGAPAQSDLDALKLKCNVTPEVAYALARDLDVPLDQYLDAGTSVSRG